jgi:hypothetical protein
MLLRDVRSGYDARALRFACNSFFAHEVITSELAHRDRARGDTGAVVERRGRWD